MFKFIIPILVTMFVRVNGQRSAIVDDSIGIALIPAKPIAGTKMMFFIRFSAS